MRLPPGMLMGLLRGIVSENSQRPWVRKIEIGTHFPFGLMAGDYHIFIIMGEEEKSAVL